MSRRNDSVDGVFTKLHNSYYDVLKRRSSDYSKETNTQASLGRIHDRLDTIDEKIDAKFDKVNDDLKLIISKVK